MHAMEKSSLAPADKHGILSWYRETIAKDKSAEAEIVKKEPARFAPIVEKELEAAAVGILLGITDAQFKGLDIRGKYPVDGILGLVALLASLGLTGVSKDPNHPSRDLARHIGNIGTDCNAIFMYRKARAWRESKLTPVAQTASASPATAKVSADSLISAAQNL